MGRSTMIDKEAERLYKDLFRDKLKWYQKIVLRFACISDAVSYRKLPARYSLRHIFELMVKECVSKEEGGSDM